MKNEKNESFIETLAGILSSEQTEAGRMLLVKWESYRTPTWYNNFMRLILRNS